MVRGLASTALLLTALLALAGVVLVRVDAVRVSRVLTGSMAPVVPPGSVVVSRPVAADTVRLGDLVMFLPPAPFSTGGTPVVHRVVELRHERGDILLRTKGDANAARDPWTLNASRSTLHRVAWSSATAGRVADLLARGGGALLLGVVVALLAVRMLLAMWRPRGARRGSRDTRRALRDTRRAPRGRHRARRRVRRPAPAVEWLRDAAVG
jgi:signal peptidase